MVNNNTLKKLNALEIGELGLYNEGIYTFIATKGIKTRVKEFKRIIIDEKEIHFEGGFFRWEIIIIQNKTEHMELAIRLFNKETNNYEDFYPVLNGLYFLR